VEVGKGKSACPVQGKCNLIEGGFRSAPEIPPPIFDPISCSVARA
jgi:hypothetical protein